MIGKSGPNEGIIIALEKEGSEQNKHKNEMGSLRPPKAFVGLRISKGLIILIVSKCFYFWTNEIK